MYFLNLFHYFIVPLFIEHSLLWKSTSAHWSHGAHTVDGEERRTTVRKRASALQVPRSKEVVCLSSPVSPYELPLANKESHCVLLQIYLLKTIIKKKRKKQCLLICLQEHTYFPSFLFSISHAPEEYVVRYNCLVITGSNFSFDLLVQDCGL